MASLIAYPSSLPRPQASTITPAERRILSDKERPRDARAAQIDRLEYERLTFPALTQDQAETFQTWWEEDLIFGGAWFAAQWPLPRGFVVAVRKFAETPDWTFVGSGISGRWRVSVICEVRGRGELPIGAAGTGLLDTFTGPVAPINTHTPDIAPDGFTWSDTILGLNGSGALVIAEETTEGFSDSNTGWLLPFAFPLRMEMDCTVPEDPLPGNARTYAEFDLNGNEDNVSIFIVASNNSDFEGVVVDFFGISTSGLIQVSATVMPCTIVLEITATTATLTVNGTETDSVTGDFASLTEISSFSLLEGKTNSGDSPQIDRIRVFSPGL